MMTEIDEEEDWAVQDEAADDDSDSNAVVAESTLDRMACGLGGKTMFPHILNATPQMLQQVKSYVLTWLSGLQNWGLFSWNLGLNSSTLAPSLEKLVKYRGSSDSMNSFYFCEKFSPIYEFSTVFNFYGFLDDQYYSYSTF